MTTVRTSELEPTRYPAGELSFPGYENITRVFLDEPTPEGVVSAVQLSHQSTADNVELFAPYFPAARADKPGNFDVQVMASILATGRFSTVTILDVHSDVSKKVIWNTFYSSENQPEVVFTESVDIITENINTGDYTAVIAPDKGAKHRAGFVASKLNLPLVTASKNRDQSTGWITNYSLNDTNADLTHVLVVDDICDGGMTFKILMESLPEGTTADLFISHGVFSGNAEKNLAGYNKIITTDSLNSVRNVEMDHMEVIPLL